MARPVHFRDRWRIRWLDEHGKRCSDVFPDFREAEFQLRLRQAQVEEIKRGLRAPVPADRTFDQLCDYWLKNRAPNKRSKADDESMIKRHLRPAFGPLVLAKLGVEQVDAFVVARKHLHKKTLANHLTLLISMFNAALELGWLTKAPRVHKPRVRPFDKDFQYLRTVDEMQRFLTAARDEGEAVFVLYATAVYTGMRAGELAALTWPDVDFDKRLITVQRSWDGPTKAEDVRYVPILDPLLPLLRAWRLKCPGRLVFPNREGGMQAEAGRVFQEVLKRVLRGGQFEDIERGGKRRSYIHFHSLRHTFASHWVMNRGDIFKLQKILGHKSVAMTMRYAHLAPDAFVADYARLGADVPASCGAAVERLPRTA
jgi:integrase